MQQTTRGLAIAAVLIALTAILMQQVVVGRDRIRQSPDQALAGNGDPEPSQSQPSSTEIAERNTLDRKDRSNASALVPVGALAWAADRGYQSSGDYGLTAIRPYEYYDQATLEKLADDGDGLAQLILAERLSFSDPDKADFLYIEAAINGKTAGLIGAAGDRLLIVPGQKGYGFPVADAGGDVSDEYLEVLRFYAAAEYLGDFVGTELLASHLEIAQLLNKRDSLQRICSSGHELANAIIFERYRRWGASDESEVPTDWAEIPDPICRQP